MTFDQLIDELDSIINPAPVKKEPKDMTPEELINDLIESSRQYYFSPTEIQRAARPAELCLPENYSDKLGYFTTKIDNILVKIKSRPPEKSPTIAEIAKTIKVSLTISFLLGQVTLVNSSLTSER